jgi:hypothetical protein
MKTAYFLSFFLMMGLICAPSWAEPADPKLYLQMIYEGKGGYIIPAEEIDAICKGGDHPQYGEIPYESAAHILDDLHLSKQDVFYDLGSGTGKLVLQVYLATPVKRSVGVELSKTRWNIAESCRKQVIADDHITPGRDLVFLNQNISDAHLSDATVCFISGVAFPASLIQSLMNRLSSLGHDVKVISVLPLPVQQHFTLIKTYNLPMSWCPEGVDVCLYQVTPGAPPETSANPHKRKKRGKRRDVKKKG